MRKSEWFLILMVVVFFTTGAWFYPQLPAVIVSHWNAAGQANGSMSRVWGVFLFPIIFLILAAIFFAIPRVDPRRENIAKFRNYFDWFVVALALLLYYIYLLTLFWNVGYVFNLSGAILPPIAALIYIIGMILPHTEPNWFIGIRTPWTISNAAVWHRTHQVGGWVFRIAAVISLLGVFFSPTIAVWFLVVPILGAALGLVVYSYVLYEKLAK